MQHLAHSDTNLYKATSSGYPDATNMLNMQGSDGQQHLLPSYHQSSSMQHMQNYSQQQQPIQISTSVTMSRLNPKAPDFSVHAMTNKQAQQQMYNGYAMGTQNNSSMHSMSKSGMSSFQRASVGTPQSRWPLMQMQQPFGQHQSELISGMAGMTLHSIARAAGAFS